MSNTTPLNSFSISSSPSSISTPNKTSSPSSPSSTPPPALLSSSSSSSSNSTASPSPAASHDNPSLFEREVALEAEMAGLGASRLRRRTENAREKGRESSTCYGKSLISSSIETLSAAITEDLAVNGSKAGHGNIAYRLLAGQNPDVLAFLALKHVINSISHRSPLTRTAMALASDVEHEARLAHFEEVNPEQYKSIMHYMSDHSRSMGSAQNRWNAFLVVMNRQQDGWEGWTASERHHVGMKLIDLVIRTTGYVSLRLVKEGRDNSRYYLQAEPALLEWAEQRQQRAEFLSPLRMPMLIPPQDWHTPFDGGYHTPALPPLTLVKTPDRAYLESLAVRDMPEVYGAVNALQRTGWIINRKVLDVAHALWERGGGMAGLPDRADTPMPPRPFDPAAMPEDRARWPEEKRRAWKTWKQNCARIYSDNAASGSRRLLVSQTLWIADRFREDTFYFPYQLDFRGRIYAVPSCLQPQGSDFAKGLLTFAEGKGITLEHGSAWLAVHTANMWGEDKIPLPRRVDWTFEHETMLFAIAADPLERREWMTADKPWEFLACCFEWAEFREASRAGKPYVSHLPVAMDGTCNGLQIYSLLLRDPVGGAAVNLLPPANPEEDKAADIYQVVADKVIARLEAMLKDPATDDDTLYLCSRWLDFGINRKTTKRQVMVLPYGGTRRSCGEYTFQYILDHIEERRTKGVEPADPWGEDMRAASKFLSGLIWEAIGETVVKAREAMDWLQSCARIAAKHNVALTWTSPVGFPVRQFYHERKEKRVKTRMGDSAIVLSVRESTKKLDRQRQTNGIAPNFVHSLDAAALMRSVNSALDEGIRSFAMVHDSYGVHAADAVLMSSILRESFVDLFSEDILGSFREELLARLPKGTRLPKAPEPGTLDIEAVLESPYFFA